jgi:hypothetical protein
MGYTPTVEAAREYIASIRARYMYRESARGVGGGGGEGGRGREREREKERQNENR